MPLKDHEIISVFSRGSMGHASLLGERRMPYNPQGVKPVEECRNGKRNSEWLIGSRPSHKATYIQTGTGYPKSVLDFSNNEKSLHPTQKPVTLLEYLIRTYTNKGETVLDNTMGSGSTGVACVNTGRSFIGMELDPGYFETAQRRIAEAQQRLEVVS